MTNKIKKIASLMIGVPSAIIVCSEANSNEGFVLQIIAVVALAGVLAINGVFQRARVNG